MGVVFGVRGVGILSGVLGVIVRICISILNEI